MTVRELPLEHFVGLIAAREPFAFSRWGDGEWQSVLGRAEGHNTDGHEYFPAMGRELGEVLQSRPPYLLGMQQLALRLYGDDADEWLRRHDCAGLDWIEANVFHEASRLDRIGPLADALRSAGVVLVGPEHLDGLTLDLGVVGRVVVPSSNAYLSWREWTGEAARLLPGLAAGTVVALSAGMPAKLATHALHAEHGDRHAVVDFGSVWDFYAGVDSRGYMREKREDAGASR